MEDKNPGPLSVARDIVALAAVFLFFGGFVYRYYYSSALGGRHDGEAPAYEYVISSWTVFQRDPWAFVVPALVLVVVYAARKGVQPAVRQRQWYAPTEALILVAVAFGTFWWIHHAASETANAVATQTRQGITLNAVEFTFSDKVRKRYPILQKDSDADQLRILGRDGDFVYILDQADATDKSLPAASLYAIPLDGIDSYVSVIP